MTLSSLIFEILEMSSSVRPSAKYSSLGSGDMLASGRTTMRRLSIWTSCDARASDLEFLDLGPDSQPLRPTPLSSPMALIPRVFGRLPQFKQGANRSGLNQGVSRSWNSQYSPLPNPLVGETSISLLGAPGFGRPGCSGIAHWMSLR